MPFRGLFGKALRHDAVYRETWLALIGWHVGVFKVGPADRVVTGTAVLPPVSDRQQRPLCHPHARSGAEPSLDSRFGGRTQQLGYDVRVQQGHCRRLYRRKATRVRARADTLVYTEKRELFCICPETGEQRPLAFHGFEADRTSLKYLCPAAAYDIDCAGRVACEAMAGCRTEDYGRVVRVPLRTDHANDLGSPTWKRKYKARTALERINSRIDQGYGFESHYIRGRAKMTLRANLSMCVMIALALASVDQPVHMRSLVKRPAFRDTG